MEVFRRDYVISTNRDDPKFVSRRVGNNTLCQNIRNLLDERRKVKEKFGTNFDLLLNKKIRKEIRITTQQ